MSWIPGSDQAPITPVENTTPETRQSARLLVCTLATDADDARVILDALGLLDTDFLSVVRDRPDS